jgi:iron complex transport system substrate-binding protein
MAGRVEIEKENRMPRITHARFMIAALAIALALGALAGCSAAQDTTEPLKSADSAAESAFPVTITDDAGRSVTIETEPARIVSLAPANTEILFAIGAGDRVVGVTTYDDYPAEVAEIAQVGDFAGPNLEAVAAAEPDLVLATTGVQGDVIAKLEELGAIVIAVDPQTLDGLYEAISEVGMATGEFEGAEAVIAEMRADVSEVEEAVSGLEPASAFIEIGQNPLFTVGTGTLLHELVTIAGGTNVVTEPGYVPYSVEQLVESDPAVYLATKGSSSDPAAIEKRAGFGDIAAIKNGRVVIMDDNLVSRPGPRAVLGLRQIAEGIHPEAFGK